MKYQATTETHWGKIEMLSDFRNIIVYWGEILGGNIGEKIEKWRVTLETQPPKLCRFLIKIIDENR